MTILVKELNEPWKRVYAEVLGQDMLGEKSHVIKKGMTKRNLEFNVHTALAFYYKFIVNKIFITLKRIVNKIL